MNFASLLKPGPAPAVRLGATVLTHSELDAISVRVARLLRSRGITPGDRIGLMLGSALEATGVSYGVLRAGAVIVQIDIRSDAAQVARALADAGSQLVFAWHECLDVAEAGARLAAARYVVVHPVAFTALLESLSLGVEVAARRAPGDTAVILYLAGGREAELTHGELVERAHGAIARLDFDSLRDAGPWGDPSC